MRKIAPFLFAFFSCVGTFSQSTVGLVAYYPFNGNANDVSWNGNHGTLINDPQFTSDEYGIADNALLLDGINQYVYVPHNDVLNLESYTYSVKIKTNAAITYAWAAVISKHNGAINWETERFLYLIGSSCFPSIVHSLSNGSSQTVTASKSLCDGFFHTITVTHDGSTRLYIDGVLEATGSNSITPNTTNPLNIGRSFYNNGKGYINGVLDEVRIYNRALSNEEVVSLYLGGVPTIANISTTMATPGSSLVIIGANFSTTPENNIVYFGAVRAAVTNSTSSQLTVMVPEGATYAPITVTANGRSAISADYFIPTFNSGLNITNTTFQRSDITGSIRGQSLDIADLNLDGNPDIVVANTQAKTISIYKNPGNAIFSTSPEVSISLLGSPYYIQANDIDSDGKKDVLVLDETYNKILIFRNVSAGGELDANAFETPVEINTSIAPRCIAFSDVDSDGKPDIIVGNGGGIVFQIFKNNSAPGLISFASPTGFSPGNGSENLSVADFDGDGKHDFAMVSYGGGNVALMRNSSTPLIINNSTLTQNASLTTGLFPFGGAPGDLDGNGKIDFIITNSSNDNFSVFRNTSSVGSITFATENAEQAGDGPWNIALSDLNGDGKLDVACVNYIDGKLSVLQNNSLLGSISLMDKIDFTSGPNPWDLAIGDLDLDSRPDIVTVTSGPSGYVSVFLNKIPVDSSPPVLLVDAALNYVVLGTSASISGQFEDLETSIINVNVIYRSVTNSGEEKTIALSKAGNNWVGSIPASDIGELGIEYKFEATNEAMLKLVTDYKLIRVKLAGFKVPYENFGSTIADYRIVSMPLDLTESKVNINFGDELGNYDKYNWRMFTYENGETKELNGDQMLQPGIGYWLIAKQNPNKDLRTGEGLTVEATLTNPYSSNLVPGWNLIGNPYNFNLSWPEIKSFNPGLENVDLWTYNDEGYSDLSTLLKNGEGGFIYLLSSTGLEFPVTMNKSINGGRENQSNKGSAKAMDAANWELLFTLKQGTRKTNYSGIGMKPDASNEADRFDKFSPPRLSEFLDLNHEKLHLGNHMTKDVVEHHEEYTWSFNIESTNNNDFISMTWSNDLFNIIEKELFLHDETERLSINMRSLNSYAFKSPHKFKIIYGDGVYIQKELQQDVSKIISSFPNPAHDEINLLITVPGWQQVEAVTLDLINAQGQIAANLYKGNLESGVHFIQWNNKINSNQQLSPGIYFVKLSTTKGNSMHRVVIR